MSDPTDLVLHALDQKAVDFKNTFDELIQDKLVDAIDARKQDIAKNLFNKEVEVEDEEEVPLEDDGEEVEHDQEELESDTEEDQNG